MKSLFLKQAERFLREQKNNKRWMAVFLCLAVIVAIGTTAALKYTGIAVTKDGEMHVHTDDCYKEEKILVCEEAEFSEAHTHDDSCYSEGERELDCAQDEHSHDDGCYDENGELCCGQDEHSHDDGCYSEGERTLTCGLEESAGESSHVHDDSCYEIRKVLICGEESGEEADADTDTEVNEEEEIPEEVTEDVSGNDVEEILEDVSGNDLPEEMITQECEDEDGTVKVIAQYGPEAGLPEGAELKVKRIFEDDADYQKYEEEFREELEDEEAVMGLLLDIGFYEDGEEVEPTGAVSITVQMLDENINVEEKTDVVHFGSEKESFKGVDVEEDGDGSKAANIELNSFSVVAFSALAGDIYEKYSITSIEELDGRSFLIAFLQNNERRIMTDETTVYATEYEENSALGSMKFSEDTAGRAIIDREVTEWSFKKVEGTNGFHIISSDGKYLNIENYKVELLDKPQVLYVDMMGDGIEIRGGRSSYGDDFYLGFISNCFICSEYYAVEMALYTRYEAKVPTEFTISYWKNENSPTSFQEEVTDDKRGTLIGRKVVRTTTENGRKLISIPLTGYIDDLKGGKAYIGKLDDLSTPSTGGKQPKFYGWSYRSNANYKWEKGYEIYCGDQVQINDITVPTYVESGNLIVDVTNREDPDINLYAIWAVPVGSVVYYGGGNLTGTTMNDIKPGVMFYINTTGEIPHEPGAFDTNNYTAGVRAKNGEIEIQNPLKYWMHIYGEGNESAIRADLQYEPKDEDLLNALKNKNGGQIPVDGKIVDFANMKLSQFQDEYYIEWYVSKDHGENWHIDGALLKKTSKWNLRYNGNGATDSSTIIRGKQYDYGTNAVVHNTMKNEEQVDDEPKKTGYNFAGWNTSADGSGTSFKAGDTITVNKDEDGQVYQNGNKVDGLKAVQNAKGVWEVTLYAQWIKGKNYLEVQKTNENGTRLKGARFRLYECELDEKSGELKTVGILTAQDGNETGDNGVLRIYDLQNDTYYRLDESYAPNGYEQRNSIYFMVEVSEDQNEIMAVHIKDKEGKDITAPEWLATAYEANGTSGTNGLAKIAFTIKDEAILQNVSFRKVDESGEKPLAGAEFKLSKKLEGGGDYTEIIAEKIVSGEDGSIPFTYKEGNVSKGSTLPYGKYKLEEVKAPDGYNKITVYFEINDPVEGSEQGGMTVEKVETNGKELTSGSYTTVEAKKEETEIVHGTDNIAAIRYSYTLQVKNEPGSQKVALQKLDTDGGKLQLGGARFSVYRATEKVIQEIKNRKDGSDKMELPSEDKITEITSDKDVISDIGNLDCGTYILIEEDAPEGYILLTEPIRIVVNTTGVTAYKGMDDNAQAIEVNSVTDEETGKVTYVLKVYNSKGIELPEAGGPGTAAYTFGGLAVIAVSLMYGLGMRRKRGKGGLS